MKKMFVWLILLITLLPLPAQAQEQLTYNSQPDELAVFLNNVAYVRDQFTLPAGTGAQVMLPYGVYQATLLVSENGSRVPRYRINQASGQIVLSWDAPAGSDVREVTLEYLMSGISWQPGYDMAVASTENVHFNFFAEVHSEALTLDNAQVRLVAGNVNLNTPFDLESNMSMNQALAPSDMPTSTTTAAPGAVTIQHIYEVEPLSIDPGDTLYVQLLERDLAARRVLLWNAPYDQLVSVIYKVVNESELPFAPGIVRNYQDGLFVGSDAIELTPIGGEGSVTIGSLQTVRVNRGESVTNLNTPRANDFDYQHNVSLSVSNFGTEAVEVEVIDFWDSSAGDFIFSTEPSREPNNVLRWVITVEPGATETITYEFKSFSS